MNPALPLLSGSCAEHRNVPIVGARSCTWDSRVSEASAHGMSSLRGGQCTSAGRHGTCSAQPSWGGQADPGHNSFGKHGATAGLHCPWLATLPHKPCCQCTLPGCQHSNCGCCFAPDSSTCIKLPSEEGCGHWISEVMLLDCGHTAGLIDAGSCCARGC